MLRHGGSQPRKEEGASHHARRGKNAEAFLKRRRQSLFRAAVSFLVDIYPGWVYYYLNKIPQGGNISCKKETVYP